MSQRDDKLFPLVNRRAPILDRIRERRQESAGRELGKELAAGLLERDDDRRAADAEIFTSEAVESLAEELEVREEAINDEIREMLFALRAELQPRDVLTTEAIEAAGLVEDQRLTDFDAHADNGSSDEDDTEDSEGESQEDEFETDLQ